LTPGQAGTEQLLMFRSDPRVEAALQPANTTTENSILIIRYEEGDDFDDFNGELSLVGIIGNSSSDISDSSIS
jgi:hypothetical protein